MVKPLPHLWTGRPIEYRFPLVIIGTDLLWQVIVVPLIMSMHQPRVLVTGLFNTNRTARVLSEISGVRVDRLRGDTPHSGAGALIRRDTAPPVLFQQYDVIMTDGGNFSLHTFEHAARYGCLIISRESSGWHPASGLWVGRVRNSRELGVQPSPTTLLPTKVENSIRIVSMEDEQMCPIGTPLFHWLN